MTILEQDYRIWMKANPQPPTRPGQSWNQLCALGQFQFNDRVLGWNPVPRVTGPNASDIRKASGTLNTNVSAAPIGAWHWWENHVGQDTRGGGTWVGMFGTDQLAETLAPYAGFQSVSGYTRMKYYGWSTNYGGGQSNIPKEPTVQSNQRQVVSTSGVKRRLDTNTDDTTNAGINPPIAANTITTPVGWKTGELVNGSAVWFENEVANNEGTKATYSHSSGFTNQTTAGLKDLNPVPPIPGSGATKAEVQAIVDASDAKVLKAVADSEAHVLAAISAIKFPSKITGTLA